MGNRRVKKIVMQGFRSFPDRVTIDLSGGLTCIADPEGSGAGEICSALCFLADVPAPEGAVPSDLIFQGNSDRDPVSRMAVSVLTEGDASEGEVRITRVYDALGESQYYRDGAKCTDEEARRILSGTGIYGYSLIDRNTVFDFLTARPGTLRSMLEGASGMAWLSREADKEEEQLEVYRKNVRELRSQLAVCKEKRKQLQEEAIRVKEYKRFRSQLRENEISIMLRRIDQLERDRDLLQIRIEDAAHRIEECEKKRSELDLTITEKQIQQRDLENKEIEEQSVFLFRRSETDDEKLKVGVIDGSIAASDQRLEMLHNELTVLRSGIERERQNYRSLQKQGLKIADRLTQAEKELRRTETLLEEKRKSLSEESVLYDQTIEEQSRCEAAQASLRSQISGIEALQKSQDVYRQGLSQVITDRTGDLPDEVSREKDLRRQQVLKDKKEREELRLSLLEEQLLKAREYVSECFIRQRDAAALLSSEQSRRDLLKDQEKSFESESAGSLKFLKDAGIEGIHAVVGDVVTAGRGYDSVIAAALGAHAGDIICEDLSAASKAADYLRKHHAGRMSFIPLKELDYKYRVVPEELLAADGFVARAIDCIRYEKVYTPVFLYLLGDTLVFRDLQSAIKAGSYRGIRIVTMDGEMLSGSEVIEGGSWKNQEMRLFEHRSVLNASGVRVGKLEKQAKKAQAEYEEAIGRQEALEKQISELQREIEQDRAELHGLSLSIDMSSRLFVDTGKDVTALKDQLEQYDSERKLTDLPGQLESIMIQLRQLEQEMEHLSAQKQQRFLQRERLQVEIRDLENKYLEYTTKFYSCQCDAAVNQLSVEKTEDSRKDLEEQVRGILSNVKMIRDERMVSVRKKEEKERMIRSMEVDLSGRLKSIGSFRKDRMELRALVQRLLVKKDQSESEYRALCLEKRALEVEREDCIQSAEALKKNFYDVFQISYAEASEKKSPVFMLNEGFKESARLRNLLRTYEEVNTAAPEEFKKATEQFYSMDKQRREMEAKMDQCRENADILRAKAPVAFRQLLDKVGKEFERCFRQLSPDPDVSVRLKVMEKNGNAGASVEVMLRKPGYAEVGLIKAAPEEKGAVFAAFTAALHKVKTPALSLLDSLDDVLAPAHYNALLAILKDTAGESILAVTGTEQTGKNASSAYVYLRSDDGMRELEWIDPGKFGIYTPDTDL